ncbi:MAG: WG repeat-containing protein, partial [Bacillota bacterium]
MITINGPFIVALTIIIFLVVIKWIEWYLFQNGTFHSKKKSDSGIPVNAASIADHEAGAAEVTESKIKKFGKSVKRLFFFGKADLKRPWYVGLPFAVFIILQHTIMNKDKFEISQIVCFNTLGLLFAVLIDIFLMLKSNKDFFSVDGRKARYLKTQVAQALLACIVVAVIIGVMLINTERKYADPPGLRESVDWVIEPVYEADWPIFTEGLAQVGEDNRCGFIDQKGKVVIPFSYKEAYNFSEGLAAVRKDKKWGYIDKKGQQIIPFLFDEAFEFGDGLAPVKKGDQWMVIDKKGTVQFKTDYQCIYPFHEGVAMVEVRDKE